MSLLPREQHVLREIERSLTLSDPGLAARLSGRVSTHRRLVVAVVGAYLIAPALIVAGLVLHTLLMLDAGIVLAALTPLLLSAATYLRRARRPRHALDEP
jgi:Flp pilus assembly protein TadB